MSDDTFILEITWDDAPHLPRLVGPFSSRDEAHTWAGLNIPNGSFEVQPLAYPYLRDADGRDLLVALSPVVGTTGGQQ